MKLKSSQAAVLLYTLLLAGLILFGGPAAGAVFFAGSKGKGWLFAVVVGAAVNFCVPRRFARRAAPWAVIAIFLLLSAHNTTVSISADRYRTLPRTLLSVEVRGEDGWEESGESYDDLVLDSLNLAGKRIVSGERVGRLPYIIPGVGTVVRCTEGVESRLDEGERVLLRASSETRIRDGHYDYLTYFVGSRAVIAGSELLYVLVASPAEVFLVTPSRYEALRGD